ncbi:MAG: NADH-quinone oxidoreductase subunit NuoE [Nitrospiraceae bacterium]|nr:NADH-quinone oxidoreductase subunit NuoE [Nitrospiraceae bacterium]
MPETALTEAEIEKLEGICAKYAGQKGSVIAVLQELESSFGYVAEKAVNFVADKMEMPRSHFYGVATFYAQFHFKPRGRNIITACSGTACHVKGSDRLIDNMVREFGLPEGEDTSADMRFTLEKVNCVGACSIAPVIIINKEVHGKMTTDKLNKEIKKLKGGQ